MDAKAGNVGLQDRKFLSGKAPVYLSALPSVRATGAPLGKEVHPFLRW